MNDNITLPYLKLPENLGWQLMRLEPDEYDRRRHQLVDRVYADNGVPVVACPPAWRDGPLRRWCWLLLHVNGLDYDPDDPKPLTHWGIDFGFAPTSVREWIWAIS